jgi:hypothetical protein
VGETKADVFHPLTQTAFLGYSQPMAKFMQPATRQCGINEGNVNEVFNFVDIVWYL